MVLQLPEDAPKDTQNAPRIAAREEEPSQERIQIMAIGVAHDLGCVISGGQCLSDHIREQFKVASGCWRVVAGGSVWLRRMAGGRIAVVACGELIQANCNSLAKVHRRLAGMGRNLDELVTEREVVAGEAALLGAEDESDSASACDLAVNNRHEVRQSHNGLRGLAARAGSGSDDERTRGDCRLKGFRVARGLENAASLNGGFCFAPVVFIRCDDGEMCEAEVGHGSRRRTDIERIARRNENGVEAMALGFREQELIVERVCQAIDARDGNPVVEDARGHASVPTFESI